MNRRQFLQTTSAATMTLAASPLVPRAAAGANDRINIGLIGAGGRANDLLGQILSLAEAQNVRVTAVCDVWRKAAAATAARVKQKLGADPRPFTRYAELLALPDVDAVVIATPDYSHGPILVAALEAGKDVYIEKPMTIDLASANRAFDVARQKQRVVQAGTQRRSDGRHLGAAKVVASGSLGTLSRVTAAMDVNHPRWRREAIDCRPEEVDWEAFSQHLPVRVAFDAKLLRQWQLYRATSNGLPGLWMTHYADAVHLVTGAKYPSSAVAHGGIYVWKDGREHADTFQALVEYPEGFLFSWGMGLGNAVGVHFTLHGTKATLDLEKWQLLPEGARDAQAVVTPVQAEPTDEHMANWLRCLRSRQRPNADIQFGHQHAVATIMCALALDSGRRQKYVPDTRQIVAG